jgi:glycosyltransferase involved in cell wall biosynthesis
MEKPLVSIITPSFNQAKFIEETLKSVLSQDYPDLEYIVIDGGSADNTLAILRKYEGKIKWNSEPDYGQADAVNKGFSMAKGEILGWLNSDDTYLAGTIRTVAEYFENHPDIVMVYGDACVIDEDERTTGRYRSEPFRTERLSETCFICQPTVFMRRDVFREIGLLDINLHTCMDYDYWMRIAKKYPPEKIAYLQGTYLANSRMYPANKTMNMRETVFLESLDTVKKHFGFVSHSWTCAYINEIGVREQMKRYEQSHIVTKALIRLFYVVKMFGIGWGWKSFLMSIKEGIKYFKSRRSNFGEGVKPDLK